MERSRTASESSWITAAWVVTSRAVVDSSQISSSGLFIRAPAIITRCSMPPESSCGYCLMRASGLLRPMDASSSMARASSAALSAPGSCIIGSMRCAPSVRTGLIDERGSWKTIAARVRRRARSSAGEAPSTWTPPSSMVPVTSAEEGSRPSTARAVRDLPDPDSPTRATVSPAAMCRDTASSSRLEPPGWLISMLRSLMFKRFMRTDLPVCRKASRRRCSRPRPRAPRPPTGSGPAGSCR